MILAYYPQSTVHDCIIVPNKRPMNDTILKNNGGNCVNPIKKQLLFWEKTVLHI